MKTITKSKLILALILACFIVLSACFAFANATAYAATDGAQSEASSEINSKPDNKTSDMVIATITLVVVALALGGYLVWDIVRAKKKSAGAEETPAAAEDTPQTETPAEDKLVAEETAQEAPQEVIAETPKKKSAKPQKKEKPQEVAPEAVPAPEAVAETQPETLPEPAEEFNPSIVRESVTAEEVDSLMRDDVAETLIEKSAEKSDKTKQGIINIDTLAENFAHGETVTLDEIKKRIKGFAKTTYVKVLARGTLDKQLTVEADSFSIQAVKMIVLTGGKAIVKCDDGE